MSIRLYFDGEYNIVVTESIYGHYFAVHKKFSGDYFGNKSPSELFPWLHQEIVKAQNELDYKINKALSEISNEY